MDFNVLKYYVSVVKNLSFSKAAIECHIAQPAISQQIKKLENTLGCILILREHNQFQLTPAGESFYYDALRILDMYRISIVKCRKAAHTNTKLTIGMNGWYDAIVSSALLKSFEKKYPSINVDCVQITDKDIALGLLDNDYDVTFTWPYDVLGKKDIDFIPLVKSKTSIVVNKDNKLLMNSNMDRETLSKQCNLIVDRTCSPKAFEHSLTYYTKYGLYPDSIKEGTDANMLISMAQFNMGIVLAPSIYLPKEIEGLAILPSPVEHYVDYGMAFSKMSTNFVLSLFVEHVKREHSISNAYSDI